MALLQDGRSSKLVYKENGNTYTIAYGATSAVFSGKTVYYTYGNTLVKWSASTKTAKGVSTLKGNKDPIYANDYIISLEGGCRNYLYYTSYVGPLVANENVDQYSLKTNKSQCIVKNAYGWGAYSKYLVVPKSSMDPAYVPLYVLNMSNGKLKLLDQKTNRGTLIGHKIYYAKASGSSPSNNRFKIVIYDLKNLKKKTVSKSFKGYYVLDITAHSAKYTKGNSFSNPSVIKY